MTYNCQNCNGCNQCKPKCCKKEKKCKKRCDSSSDDECCDTKYKSCVKVKCGTISATLAVTATPSYYTESGQQIVYNYTVTNTGSAHICYPIVICDSRFGATTYQCTNIAPCGGTQTFQRTYTVVPTDLDVQSITQTAYADIFVKCKKVVRTCPASVTITFGSSDVSGTLVQEQTTEGEDQVTVTLTISNSPSSSTTAYGIGLVLPFPSGATNVVGVTGSMTINPSNVTIAIASLAAGSTNTYVFTYDGTIGQSYQWAGTITVTSFDTNLLNNGVSSTITLS